MLDSIHLGILERSLDAGMLRQRTIANNIANVDVPGFKSKHVIFEDLLQKEMTGSGPQLAAYRTNEKHIPFGRTSNTPLPKIVSDPTAMIQNSGNDVDIESEMNQLAKNQIWYNGLTQFTNSYFSKLSSVIQGGR